MTRKNGISLRSSRQISISLWKIWQKIQHQPDAEILGPVIRDQIIEQLRSSGLVPADIGISDHNWTEFITRCR